ncbi:transcriptional protein SWT1 [Hetaerina americana]|uniref:transcriptional protein SWT1 n=1 Tax=Hetaerina americana TaxID=62018 RepID=UPI003A7F1CB8
MSSSRRKRNNSKKKKEFSKDLDINDSDFYEQLTPFGVKSQLPCFNKQGSRNIAKCGHTQEVSTPRSSMVNSGNSPSTSGTVSKVGQNMFGSPLNSAKKLSFVIKTRSSLLETNALHKSPKKREDGMPTVVHTSNKKNRTRSKNNAVNTRQAVENPPSRDSESVDTLKIINTTQVGSISSSFNSRLNNISSGKNFAAQKLGNKDNPFFPSKLATPSEINKLNVNRNAGNHTRGNVSVPLPSTSRSCNDIVCEGKILKSGNMRPNTSRKRSASVNIPSTNLKKDLSQAALISRYNRAHPNKVRDIKEETKNDTWARVNQNYLRGGNTNPQSCILAKKGSKLESSLVVHNSRPSHGRVPTVPLTSSRFYPPPIINFKCSSSYQASTITSSNKDYSECSRSQHDANEDDVNMDWEDIEDEKVLHNIKVHRECYQDFGNLSDPIEDMDTNCLDVSEDYTEGCLIVLDTNILISHLKYVMELSTREYKALGSPILVIPWMVLRELDAFKKGRKQCIVHPALEIKARSAVHFINGCFSSHHPRVKGQSALDDKEHQIEIHVPDDSILNCCLQLQEKGKRVILLSNDVNFCNKAMATGILSYGRDQMDKVLIHGVSSSRTEAEKQCDKTLLKFKGLLQDFLSKFIETEMKRVFKEVWLKIILIKPPWTLQDSLKNISKHWQAVFGFVMSKSGQKAVADLMVAFKTEESSTGISPMEAEKVVQLAVGLCDTIISDNYQAMAVEYKNSFMSLSKTLKECKKGDSGAASGDQSPSELSTQVPQVPVTQPDHCEVYEIFQFIWSLVNSFCGVVCDTFGIERDVHYEKPDNFPSPEEVKGRLPEAFHYVRTIVTCLSKILETAETQLSVEHPAILSLHSFIQSMVPSEVLADKALTCEKVFIFCIDNASRMVLLNGVRQFEEVQMILLKVLNAIK